MSTYCVTVVVTKAWEPELCAYKLEDHSLEPLPINTYDIELRCYTRDYQTAYTVDMDPPMALHLPSLTWWDGWKM